MKNIKEWFQEVWVTFYTKKCRGCEDKYFHTHHLSKLGEWHYLRRDWNAH